jgi:hypothetical protein
VRTGARLQRLESLLERRLARAAGRLLYFARPIALDVYLEPRLLLL